MLEDEDRFDKVIHLVAAIGIPAIAVIGLMMTSGPDAVPAEPAEPAAAEIVAPAEPAPVEGEKSKAARKDAPVLAATGQP